ncbi:tetratricopeptide repeat protein [Glaciecola sp. XM2]|uniref:tetratricopeptide repeat protein n=1 Tax=Glaciecola sp. XM2 TaxID=1914931 RepID=UPI001BDF6649|nr:tetratricopeptide repeat protein [Glaciecola sp. XM2]MBT1451543.1 tetratricopeptide repeat protein [Glaciecola sp. XM2]
MNYKIKHLVTTLAALLLLGGCVSTKTLFGDAEQEVQTNEQEQAPITQETAGAQGIEVEPISPEEQRALDTAALVNASENRFQASKKANAPRTRALLLEALSAYQNEEYEVALTLMQSAKQLADPMNSSAYVLDGDIYVALDDVDRAAKSYDNALSLNPDNFKAANRRALLHREQGEFEQALTLYSQAIESYSAHAPSYRNRGVLYDLYLGNKALALKDYQMYADLLTYQQSQTAQDAVMLTSLSEAQLKREARRVKGWLIDVERQVQAQVDNVARQADGTE